MEIIFHYMPASESGNQASALDELCNPFLASHRSQSELQTHVSSMFGDSIGEDGGVRHVASLIRRGHCMHTRFPVSVSVGGMASRMFGRRLLASSVLASNWSLELGQCMIPHPEKAHRGGEDAYFIAHKHRAFGVADGVGGYASAGINPAIFARKIMIAAQEQFQDIQSTAYEHPIQAIESAFDEAVNLKIPGGCTVLVGVVDDSMLLRIANLGDSGLLVLRPKKHDDDLVVEKLFRTVEQQHYFNCPYQLGYPEGDSPDIAESLEIQLKIGDIIVAATDGCWDNLFDEEIQQLVTNELKSTKLDANLMSESEYSWTQRMAVVIASEAIRQAFNVNRESPFVKSAVKNGLKIKEIGLGGKVDDVTVVVGRITHIPGHSRL